MRRGPVVLLAAMLMIAIGSAWAAPPAPPLVVDADHSTATHNSNSDTGQVTYTGHVVITHGPTIIHGAHAIVYTQRQQLVKAVVTGSPTNFTYRPDTGRPVHGVADKITYLANDNMVILEGHATLHRGKEVFRAAIVHYDIVTQLL
ncbi:MAG: lipopolysaccharide transport periplasmic protein LptA, partial [Gammaproteobacteria bacterium]